MTRPRVEFVEDRSADLAVVVKTVIDLLTPLGQAHRKRVLDTINVFFDNVTRVPDDD